MTAKRRAPRRFGGVGVASGVVLATALGGCALVPTGPPRVLAPVQDSTASLDAAVRSGTTPVPRTGPGSLDVVNGSAGKVVLQGWADWSDTGTGARLDVVLPKGSAARVAGARRVARPDVAAALGRPDLSQSGFEVVLSGVGPVVGPMCLVASGGGATRHTITGSDPVLCPRR